MANFKTSIRVHDVNLESSFLKPFFLSPTSSARCPWQSHRRNYLTSAGCIANEKIVCFYCNLMYINIHSRIKLLKKKVSFSVCPGTQQGATNKLIHKNLDIWKTFLQEIQEGISSNNSSWGKKNKILVYTGIHASLLRELRHRKINK